MNKTSQKICIIAGPLGFLFFGIGLWPLAGFLPPPAPMTAMQDVVGLYQNNQLSIQLGAIMIMCGASLFAPYFAVFTEWMKRMEGGNITPYATTQAITATMVCVFFFLGGMLMAITAFRPERPPELTQLMNDLTWIILISPGAPAIIQNCAFGMAILGDKSAKPALPRWCGYFSIWVAVLFVPAQMAVMFHSGPFAWNGVLAFWIGAGIVGIWANVIAMAMLKSLKQS